MAIAALISITWLMFGYSLAFGLDYDGGNNRYIGGANKFWFRGDGTGACRACLFCLSLLPLSVASLCCLSLLPACLPACTAPSAPALLHRRADVLHEHALSSPS
jgi:hypothetical protein